MQITILAKISTSVFLNFKNCHRVKFSIFKRQTNDNSDDSNDAELQTVPSDGVSTKYFISEYDSTLQSEGEKINAVYFVKRENPDDFLGLDALINSKSSNFKKLAKEKEYDNLVFKVSGGYKKLFGFAYMKKPDLSFEFKKFEITLKEILERFLETLTEDYVRGICESIKVSLRKAYSDEKISAYENLKIYTALLSIDEKRITELLKIVGMSNTKHKLVSKFSLGMKQRLGIAIALVAYQNY